MKKTVVSKMQDDKLYAVARRCTELSDQGCANGCELCQYNIFNYVKDTREASLLKANAATDYYRCKEAHEEYNQREWQETMAPFALLAVIIGLVMWACSGCTQYKDEWKTGFGPEWFMTLDEESSDYLIDCAIKYKTLERCEPFSKDFLWKPDPYNPAIFYNYTRLDMGDYVTAVIAMIDRRWLEERRLSNYI